MDAYARGSIVYSKGSQDNSYKMKDNRWLKKKNLKVEIVRKRKYNNRSGGFSSKVHSSDIRHSEDLMQKHKEKENSIDNEMLDSKNRRLLYLC